MVGVCEWYWNRAAPDAVAFAGGEERPQPRVVLGGRVVAGEEPVLAAEGDPLEGPLAGVVVDVEKALRHVDVESGPLVLGVGDRGAHGAAREDDFANVA